MEGGARTILGLARSRGTLGQLVDLEQVPNARDDQAADIANQEGANQQQRRQRVGENGRSGTALVCSMVSNPVPNMIMPSAVNERKNKIKRVICIPIHK